MTADPLGVQLLALANKLTRAEVKLEEQETTLDGIGSAVEQFTAAAEQFDGQTTELSGLVVQLAERIGKLEAKASAPTPDRLWDWSSMDRVKAETAWATLRGWVETILIPTYDRIGDNQDLKKLPGAQQIRPPRLRVPVCWAWHRDVVVELSWLCQEWISLYRLQQGSPAKAGDWHGRYFPSALGRIRNTSTAAGCDVKHKPLDGTADAPAEPVGPDGSVDRAIELDLATRPEPPAEKKP